MCVLLFGCVGGVDFCGCIVFVFDVEFVVCYVGCVWYLVCDWFGDLCVVFVILFEVCVWLF